MPTQIDALGDSFRVEYLIVTCISVYSIGFPTIDRLIKQRNPSWDQVRQSRLFKMIELQLKLSGEIPTDASIQPIALRIFNALEEKLYAQQVNGEPYDDIF